jgi:hypothetical protein
MRNAIGSLVLAVGLLCGGPAAAYTPQPLGKPAVVEIGEESGKPYLRLDRRPLSVPLRGPGRLTGYVRVHFGPDESGQKQATLVIGGLAAPDTIAMTFTPSDVSRYLDGRQGRPSEGVRFTCDAPPGPAIITLRGRTGGEAGVFAVIYYDGPPQPAELLDQENEEGEGGSSPVTVSASVGLQIAYDTNFLNYSDDYLRDWETNRYPYKFRIKTKDDLVIAPSLDVEFKSQPFAMGSTRLSFGYTDWRYAQNPIKNNEDFEAALRQYVGRGRSFELAYTYSPEQYIRQLSDRPPFVPSDTPLIWPDFRFTRNVLSMAYRHRFSRRFNGKLQLENNRRYYNQPFIENDIDAWELRGALYWQLMRPLRLQLDYSYEQALARGHDAVGETHDSSDDSDASYERDLYRLELAWQPDFLQRFVERVDIGGLWMHYWFTTDKPLIEDPYHCGRKDQVTILWMSVHRSLGRRVNAELGMRQTVRAVDSPWQGDIALDKDYRNTRYTLSLEYEL